MEKISSSKATFFGVLALIIWAVEPLLVSELEGLPFFESLTIIFGSSFLVTAIRITINKRWKQVFSQPIFLWLVGLTCVCGSDFCYILGAECAPIAHVDLIDYLWPCFVVIFASLLPKEKFQIHQMLGAIIGMCGILVLLRTSGSLSFNHQYLIGYSLAFYGALIWGAYAALSRHYENAPTEMVGMYCGVGALICFGFHCYLEKTVTPTLHQVGLASTLGILGAGLAYQLWDYGVKFGNFRLLGALTYFARISAMCMLVMLGKEPFSWELVVAVVLSCVGIFLSTISKEWLHEKLFFLSFLKPSKYRKLDSVDVLN